LFYANRATPVVGKPSLIGKVRFARHPPGIDAKCGDQFLQADFLGTDPLGTNLDYFRDKVASRVTNATSACDENHSNAFSQVGTVS